MTDTKAGVPTESRPLKELEDFLRVLRATLEQQADLPSAESDGIKAILESGRKRLDLADAALQQIRLAASSSLLPVPEPEVQRDNNRCAICAWPLIEGDGLNPLGCVRGNCSLRPHPEKFYDFDRAEKEYGIKFDPKYRAGLPVGRQLECGQNPVLDATLVGCGKPLGDSEIFRCIDCSVPFHRECARKHFIAGESVLTEAIANEQFRRDDVREGLRIVVSARDYLNEQTPKDWTATELLNSLWGKFMKEQSSWKQLAVLPVGESTRGEIAGRCPACSTLLLSPSNDGRTAGGAADAEQSVLMGQPASATNSWISVEQQRLPDKFGLYEVCVGEPVIENDPHYDVYLFNPNDQRKGDSRHWGWNRVLCWRPFPEPPEEFKSMRFRDNKPEQPLVAEGLGESREPLPTATDIQNESSPGAIRPEPLIYDGREIQTVDGEPRMRNKLPSVPAEIESQPCNSGTTTFTVNMPAATDARSGDLASAAHCTEHAEPAPSGSTVSNQSDQQASQPSADRGKVEELAHQLAEKDIPHRPKCSPEKCHCSGTVIAVRTAYEHGAEAAYSALMADSTCTQEKP